MRLLRAHARVDAGQRALGPDGGDQAVTDHGRAPNVASVPQLDPTGHVKRSSALRLTIQATSSRPVRRRYSAALTRADLIDQLVRYLEAPEYRNVVLKCLGEIGGLQVRRQALRAD